MSDWTSANAEVRILLELPTRGTADFSQGEGYFIENTTTLIRFSGLTVLTGRTSLNKGKYTFGRHGIICARREVEPPCQIPAWEHDKTRLIVSTADAADKLTASSSKHGWLPVRLRRNQ